MSYDPLFTLVQQQQKEIEERLSPRTFDHQSAQYKGWRAERQIAMIKAKTHDRSWLSIAYFFWPEFSVRKLKSRRAQTNLLQPRNAASSTR